MLCKSLRFKSYGWIEIKFVRNWLCSSSTSLPVFTFKTKMQMKTVSTHSTMDDIRSNNRSVKSIFALGHVSIVLIKWNERSALNVATLSDFHALHSSLTIHCDIRHANRRVSACRQIAPANHTMQHPPYKYEAGVADHSSEIATSVSIWNARTNVEIDKLLKFHWHGKNLLKDNHD